MELFKKSEEKGRTGVFSVFDIKAQTFLDPWCSPTDGSAIRAFAQAVNDSRSNFSKYPEDFNLYRIGNWDESSGVLLKELPKSLALASSLVVIPSQEASNVRSV